MENRTVLMKVPFSFSIRGHLARWFSWVYYPVNTTALSEDDKNKSQIDMVTEDENPLVCSDFIRDSGLQFSVNKAYPKLDVVFTNDFSLIEDDVVGGKVLSKIMYLKFRIFPCSVQCLSEPYVGSVYDALSTNLIYNIEYIFSREISEIGEVSEIGIFIYFRKID